MKRFISILLVITLFSTLVPLSAIAEGVDGDFDEKIINLVSKYDNTQDYYSEIVIDTEKNTIQTDDEKAQSLDEYGVDIKSVESSIPQIPALPVLEAMGKDAELDEQTGEITFSEDGTELSLDLSEKDIPESAVVNKNVENGVMTITTEEYSVKDHIAYFNEEQLRKELSAEMVLTDDEKIIISNPFQTKRLIVTSSSYLLDKHGAIETLHNGNTYVLQYKTEKQAREAFEYFENRKDIQNVCADSVMKSDRSAPDMKTYGKDMLQSDRYIQALKQNNKTTEIKIAVIDTGVDASHPILKNRVLKGYDVLTKKACVKDRAYHGTHVSGIIASATPSNVKILPITVLDEAGRGTELTIKAGIDYAIKQKVKIINMSLGGICTSDNCPIKQSINSAVKAGITVVVAAGNDSADTKTFCPAKHSACITVSACNEDGKLAPFTNYGSSVDVCAPGVNIYSSVPGNSYDILSGTSMAAPFVSAAVSLLYVNNPLLTPTKAEQLINAYSADMLFSGKDVYTGWGLVNLGIALGDTDLPADSYSYDINNSQLNVNFFSKVSPYLCGVSTYREDDLVPTNRSFSTTSTNSKIAYFDGKYIRFKGAGECNISITSPIVSKTIKVVSKKQEVWIDYAASSFAGGNGTAKNPYQIKTAGQLAKFAVDMRKGNSFKGKYFKLMNNVNLSGKKWITAYCFEKSSSYLSTNTFYDNFEGVFDGANHKIIGMDVFDIPLVSNWFDDTPVNMDWYYNNTGFIGDIKDATIKNLGIENAVCNSKLSGGLLANYVYQNSRVLNCYTSGFTMGYGLISAANNYNIRVGNCYSSASTYKSGICGTVYSSAANGNVVFNNVFFCGEIINNDENNQNYNFATNIKSIKGYCHTSLFNCFSAAKNEKSVGFANNCEYSKIYKSCYLNLNKNSLVKKTGSAVSLTPKALSFFKTKSSYAKANWHKSFAWDFKNVWAISSKINNGFPYLKNNVPSNSKSSLKTGTWNDYAATSFAGGSGTKSNPYLVSNATQLARISTLYRYGGGKNVYFKLTRDIDLSAHEWMPIGTGSDIDSQDCSFDDVDRKRYFMGNIDGAGHTISGMHIETDGYYIGFITKLNFGTVKNLNFSNAFVSANEYFGIICGENHYYSSIVNCSVSGMVNVKNARYAGFICGLNKSTALIKGCTVTALPDSSQTDKYTICAFASQNEGEIEQSYLDSRDDALNTYTICVQNKGFVKDCYVRSENILKPNNQLQTENYENCYIADNTHYWTTGKLFDSTVIEHTISEENIKEVFKEFDEQLWTKNDDEMPSLKLPASYTETVLPTQKWKAANGFAGGDGTKNNPYLIATAEQLAKLRDYKPSSFNGKYFRIIRNIDLKGKLFNDEDTGLSTVVKFDLDGNNKTISNLIVNNNSALFNFSFNGSIRNLNIKNLQGIATCGLFPINSGKISGCSLSGTIKGTETTGGLCVVNYGVIEKCSVNAKIYAADDAGAIVYKNKKNISNCYAQGLMVNCLKPKIVGLSNTYDELTSNVNNCYTTMNGQVPKSEVLESLDYQNVWNEAEGSYPYLKPSPAYKINYVFNGGKAASNTEYDFTPNSNVVLKTPYRSGYYFDGWYKDATFTNKVFQVGLTEKSDVTLYAKWLEIGQPTVKATCGENTIKLSWKKCINATHYSVYEFNSKTNKYKLLSDTSALNYSVKKRSAGTTYTFLVRAYYKDKSGKKIISPFTSADNIKAITLCAAPKVKATSSKRNVTLKWNSVRGAIYYNIYEYNASKKTYSLIKAKATSKSYSLKNVRAGKHYYLVRAYNKNSLGSKFKGVDLIKVTIK